MKPRTSQRTAYFTESVIREMTRLAILHGAVNLAQGFPDFPAPEAVKEAAVRAIRDDVNQYAITWGARRLREAIARKTGRYNGVAAVDPEREVTVCCGATETMIASLMAIINPGDEVVIFEPFYENYGPDTYLSGATPRFVTLREPDWRFDEAELAGAFNDRTKAIILTTPHNPTGKVFSREELSFIADLCQKWDAIAITDEIYEHILYDAAHVSIASLDGMRDRTITVNAASKTFSVTGWRVGYAVAPPDLTDAIRKVHDFLTVGAPAPLQEAVAVALDFEQDYFDDLSKAYARRRDLLISALSDAGFRCFIPQGAYYVMTDISAFRAKDDVAFCDHLIRQIGVAAVPGSSFYRTEGGGRQQVRFCFCKRDETLREAAERLQKLRS
ncbi:MAG: aminotransferase class I/II-fold pyridoxal phosphate-dependent enzyme [Candidatus Latescibacteria bacterium]|nr:aminotransferase class I/II-fold pyridoxal phosphate-dependent enzyme [Candidatus Latescibacterota bacterium]